MFYELGTKQTSLSACSALLTGKLVYNTKFIEIYAVNRTQKNISVLFLL
ncbi:MAG: hypothetical protein AAB116_27400 [Candidatus Poribacteria bacterium]